MAESREIESKKSGFCTIIELLSCTTLQYYMYWKRMECQLTGTSGGQINFLSFRKWSSSDGATARVFWNNLGSSFKTPRNLGVSTRSFDGQLLKNSSSRMSSQGPNDRVHARVLNFSSRWVSVWTRLIAMIAGTWKALFTQIQMPWQMNLFRLKNQF